MIIIINIDIVLQKKLFYINEAYNYFLCLDFNFFRFVFRFVTLLGLRVRVLVILFVTFLRLVCFLLGVLLVRVRVFLFTILCFSFLALVLSFFFVFLLVFLLSLHVALKFYHQ